MPKQQVIQFQIPSPEVGEISEQLAIMRQLSQQIGQLQRQVQHSVSHANTAFRSAWRGAALKGNLEAGIEMPELIDPRTGNLNVGIENNIATWKREIEEEVPGETVGNEEIQEEASGDA